MKGIFGSIKKIDMTNGYTAKKFKNKIHYVVLKNASGKGKMLIGGQYKEHFSRLVDLLETKQK